MKYLAMIQARCGSTRLPNKVLKDLCGKPALQRMIERVQKSKLIDEVMVITSIGKENLPILKLCAELGVRCGIGSEDDVLDRYYQNAKLLQPEYVIRLTADCPCFDAELLDLAISQMTDDIDYCAAMSETLADGLDLEIFKFAALKKSWQEAGTMALREHVTQYMIRNPQLFKQLDFVSPIGNFGHHRWTVDEPEDFALVEKVYQHFLGIGNPDFGYQDIVAFLDANPDIYALNSKFARNEGLAKSYANDKPVDLQNI